MPSTSVLIRIEDDFHPDFPYTVVVYVDGTIHQGTTFNCHTRVEAEMIVNDLVKMAVESGGRHA